MLGADLLQRGGPPFSPGTSFSSTTRFSQYGGSSSTRTEAEAGPRNKDLETGGGTGPDPSEEMRRLDDTQGNNNRTSPGPGAAGARQIQGFGQERVNNDGERFFIFSKIFIFN